MILSSILLISTSYCDESSRWYSIPLIGGVNEGYYYVQMELGYPTGKTQNLIVDTGSKMTIVPCKGCSQCNEGHDNGLFDPRNSDTIQGIQPGKSYLNWVCPVTEQYVFNLELCFFIFVIFFFLFYKIIYIFKVKYV